MLYASTYANFVLVFIFLAGLWWFLPQSATGQSILPARPEAPGGGNPFEGLGRPDDPNPSRIIDTESGAANGGALPPEPDTAGGEITRAKKRSSHSPQLVPPPSPVVPEGFSSADDKNPMKQAILHIGRKEYEKAHSSLVAIIKDDPQNLKAVYLEAIVQVYRKKYLEAESGYKKVLELSNDEDLRKMAELGLKKLDDMSSDLIP